MVWVLREAEGLRPDIGAADCLGAGVDGFRLACLGAMCAGAGADPFAAGAGPFAADPFAAGADGFRLAGLGAMCAGAGADGFGLVGLWLVGGGGCVAALINCG